MPISRIRILSMTIRSALTLFMFFPFSVILLKAQSLEQPTPLTGAQTQARDALNEGVEAFKNAQFQGAEQHFIRARELDPTLLNARLYLATAYASQYIPGAPSEENVRMGKLATDEYREVLQVDTQNLSAIDGLASILYQRAGQPFSMELFQESKSYYKKHIEISQQDPVPYYFVGVIDWALAYRGNTELRREFNQTVGGEGLKDDEPLPEVLRAEYVQQYESTVDEGMEALKQAIRLKPDYDDAMTYLNLLYRRKADMADTPTERERYTEMADDLLDHVKELKQKKAGMPEQVNP